MTSQIRQAFAWMVCVSLAFGASSSLAGTINYGDFGPDFPPGVTVYQDVRESSGTDPVPPERYGPPTLSADTLDFDPTSFVASATGGDSDITDGQLNYDVEVIKGLGDEVAGGIGTLLISERGDFTLFGGGTALTSVSGGVSVDIDILEVDGSPIDTPISVFASNSIVRDLVTDGPVVLAPWDNAVLVELDPVLTANDIDFEFGVTKAKVVINDQLIATSEPNSVAFIAKKDFKIEPGIVPNPDFVIPEPASAALVMALVACCPMLRRRQA